MIRMLCTRQTAPPHTMLCKLAVFSSVRTVSRRKLEVFRLRPNEESGVLVLTNPIDFFEAFIALIEMLKNANRASESNRFSRKSKSCSSV